MKHDDFQEIQSALNSSKLVRGSAKPTSLLDRNYIFTAHIQKIFRCNYVISTVPDLNCLTVPLKCVQENIRMKCCRFTHWMTETLKNISVSQPVSGCSTASGSLASLDCVTSILQMKTFWFPVLDRAAYISEVISFALKI